MTSDTRVSTFAWRRPGFLAVAVAGGLAVLSTLAGCEPQQVDQAKDAIQKANDGAKAVRDALKPDTLLFKDIRLGESTADDIRRSAGQPETVRVLDGGGQRLEYPRGPAGAYTYMVTIDPAGKVLAVEQVLTAARFAQVVAGMTPDQVRALLGKPSQENHFSLKKETVWGWRWQEEPTRQAMFNVHFGDSHRVTGTSRSETPENDNR